MPVLKSYTAGVNGVPHHRGNRRRERPARRSFNHKFAISDECAQGLFDAKDPGFSTLNYFGGEVGDDELVRMGILYEEQEDGNSHANENAASSNIPLRQDLPMFVMKPSRRSRRRSYLVSLPRALSVSDLRDDPGIARFLSSVHCTTPTIQHRDPISSTSVRIIDTPQSLPPLTTALSHQSSDGPGNFLDNTNTPTFVSPEEDWTFITHTHTRLDSTPSSELETWILCDDS